MRFTVVILNGQTGLIRGMAPPEGLVINYGEGGLN